MGFERPLRLKLGSSWAKNDLEFPKGIKEIESTFMPFLRLTYSKRVRSFFEFMAFSGFLEYA